jgi:hypothetical protein
LCIPFFDSFIILSPNGFIEKTTRKWEKRKHYTYATFTRTQHPLFRSKLERLKRTEMSVLEGSYVYPTTIVNLITMSTGELKVKVLQISPEHVIVEEVTVAVILYRLKKIPPGRLHGVIETDRAVSGSVAGAGPSLGKTIPEYVFP